MRLLRRREPHRQTLHAPRFADQIFGRELRAHFKISAAFEHGVQQNPEFQSRQVSAQTNMRAATECEMLVGFAFRSEEHTSELQSLMRISYAVFCLKTHNKK